MHIRAICIILFFLPLACQAQSVSTVTNAGTEPIILTGADRLKEYLPVLRHKKVGLVINQTAQINNVLLPDTLLKCGIHVVKIFSPEHGFRGKADAGAKVASGRDSETGLPVISLYGNNKKPTTEQLSGVDIIVYDLQDVGVRFYTYISTLEYLMDACAENKLPLLILDRPNPLGFIVDGPVLEKKYTSFVGMQPIPVLYGMTPGEYAKMLIGEGWLKNPDVSLQVIPCLGYSHRSLYNLPVAPSPNLKSMAAVYLYASLCFFEGTPVSLGRGTDKPFMQFGHPSFKGYDYSFVPRSMEGAGNPPQKDKVCFGKLLADNDSTAVALLNGRLQLKWLIEAYHKSDNKKLFFNSFFDKLAGTGTLKAQIIAGKPEEEIRASWEPELSKFRAIRKKYLLYDE